MGGTGEGLVAFSFAEAARNSMSRARQWPKIERLIAKLGHVGRPVRLSVEY